MKPKGFLVQIHQNQCLLCFQERISEQVMCTCVGVLIERCKPHWCPSCTHGPNLAIVDCRMPMTPVPFYQYPHTGAPSSSLIFFLLLQHKALYHQNLYLPRSHHPTPLVSYLFVNRFTNVYYFILYLLFGNVP
jgi:hypothetical protein